MASPQPHSIVARYNHQGHSILAHYNLSVSRQHQSIQNINENPQCPKLMITPTDWFKFHINAYAISFSFDSNTTLFVNSTTLVQSCKEIACKTFFQEGQDFLRSHLSHPNIPSESLEMIILRIMDRVQQLFEDRLHSVPDLAFANPSDSEYQVFPLDLEIIVDYEPEHVEIRMIPASKNAINSLKKFNVMKQNEHCTICKEEFDVSGDNDDDVAASAMPCDHVFHQQCIAQWLQTSHTCPLCRYPMPTAKN